jgi:hypothetical protein
MRAVLASCVLGISGAFIAVACNDVLQNDPGELSGPHDASIVVTEDGSLPPAPAEDSGSPIGEVDSTTLDVPEGGVPPPPDATPPITCGSGQKLCAGTCVAISDPLFGCGTTTCDPCAVSRASAVCAGGACTVNACNPGFADCNQKSSDGCETDLSEATHCGACNAVCPASAPNCSPAVSGFVCTTGCTAVAPTLCGKQCVDLQTSVTHCGGCNNACAAVLNGTSSCTGGQCAFTCNAGFHACGGACVSNDSIASCGGSCTACSGPANAQPTCDGTKCGYVCNNGYHLCGATCAPSGSPASCGTSCTACPTGPNASATCNGTACGIACAADFANCNNVAGDGCEVSLKTDPANCGTCGHSCSGQPCNAGVCAVPPPPDSGTDTGAPDTGPADTGSPPSDASSGD